MDNKLDPCLLRMPRIITCQILGWLYHSERGAIHNFRLASRPCRFESEYLLWRSTALHDDTRAARNESNNIIAKIKAHKEDIGSCIRDLSIGPFADEELFNVEIFPNLEGLLKSISCLRVLTWKAHQDVPPSFERNFLKWNRAAQLHLILRERKLVPLSRALLSSPQLQRLDTTALTASSTPSLVYTELPYIKACLEAKLRFLSLDLKKIETDNDREIFLQWPSVNQLQLAFKWEKGDKFRPLHELSLKHRRYEYRLENCRMWAQIMVWKNLQRLDLNMALLGSLFESLTDRAVNLMYLRFWLMSACREVYGLHPLSIGLPILNKFINSIIALRELHFGAHIMEYVEEALPSMLESTRGSLKRLTMKCVVYNKGRWRKKQFLQIFNHAPNLEFLQAKIMDVETDGCWKGFERYLSAQEKYDLATKKKGTDFSWQWVDYARIAWDLERGYYSLSELEPSLSDVKEGWDD